MRSVLLLVLVLLTGCPRQPASFTGVRPASSASRAWLLDDAPAPRPQPQVVVPLGGGMEYGYPGGYQQRVPLGGGASVVIPR